MTLLVVLIVCAAVAAALYLHRLFEGGCLPLDIAREWKLARRPISHFDEQWSKTANRSTVIVSLTTIPSRFDLIDDTLKSLLDQSRPPARIVLNIPAYSEREKTAYVVPPRFARLASVEIRQCEDYGPATKAIPALLAESTDQPILVVDDDRIYPPRMIAEAEAATRAHPDAALTFSGWVVPDDLTDRATTALSSLLMRAPAPIKGTRIALPVEIDVMMGSMGYVVRPRDYDAAELTGFGGAPPALRLVDDVRTSALCNARKLVIATRRLSFMPKRHYRALEVTALARINRGTGGNENRNNTIGIRHFADRWLCARPKA